MLQNLHKLYILINEYSFYRHASMKTERMINIGKNAEKTTSPHVGLAKQEDSRKIKSLFVQRT